MQVRQSIDMEPMWAVNRQRSISASYAGVGFVLEDINGRAAQVPCLHHVIQIVLIDDAAT